MGQVDYAALAEQARQSPPAVDYASLAAEARGSSGTGEVSADTLRPMASHQPSAEQTVLPAADEAKFQQWARDNKIPDVDAPESAYDYRGWWKESGGPAVRFGVDHFPDTFKQHGHPTFSVESKYSRGPADGGRWLGDKTLVAPPMASHEPERGPLLPAPRDPARDAADLDAMGALDDDPAAYQFARGMAKRAGESVGRIHKYLNDVPLVGRAVKAMDSLGTIPIDTTRRTPAEVAGGGVERIIEAVLPLKKVAGAVAGLPILARMAANAAAGGGVAALQSDGDPVDTFMGAAGGAILPPVSAGMEAIGGGLKRAAAGAAEDGIGGAIAASLRSAAPAEPKDMMVQALKPRSTRINFESSLQLALPEIKAAEDATGKAITNADEFLDTIKTAKKNIQGQLQQMRGPKHAIGSQVDLSSVADAMAASIPKKVQLEAPDLAASVLARSDAYRRSFSLEDAETLLRETNAELDSFYAKYPMAQRRALASDPSAAALNAQATALRQAIYNTLDAPGQGTAARELNRRYGALMEVENETFRRSNVAKRQQPESLSEQIGAVRAAGDMARGTWRLLHGDITGAGDIVAARAMRSAGKAIKDSQTMDALIRRAMAGVKDRPSPVDIPLMPTPRALLGRGPLVTPPPEDASGMTVVRGEWPERVPRPGQRMLPEGRGEMPQLPPATSLLPSHSVVVLDPKTGRLMRVYPN